LVFDARFLPDSHTALLVTIAYPAVSVGFKSVVPPHCVPLFIMWFRLNGYFLFLLFVPTPITPSSMRLSASPAVPLVGHTVYDVVWIFLRPHQLCLHHNPALALRIPRSYLSHALRLRLGLPIFPRFHLFSSLLVDGMPGLPCHLVTNVDFFHHCRTLQKPFPPPAPLRRAAPFATPAAFNWALSAFPRSDPLFVAPPEPFTNNF